MKAWIVRWGWIGDNANVDCPDVVVLSARMSAERIREYVEVLYKFHKYSFHEQLGQARYNNPQQNPYPAKFAGNWQGNIVCGHNPYLEAFLATDISVKSDGKGEEELRFNRITRSDLD